MSFAADISDSPPVAPPPESQDAAPPQRAAAMARRPWFVDLVAFALIAAVWQMLVVASDRIPGLDEVISFLWIEITGDSHGGVLEGTLWPPVWLTLRRYLLGLAIGVPIGALVGLLIGASALFRSLLNDAVVLLLVLPAVVWAFASSLWFGFGWTAPVLAVALTAVPFMAVNVRAGILEIGTGLGEMSRAYRVPRLRRLVHLLAAGALPRAVTGIRLAFMTSWNSLLILEWFGATEGVGWRARFWYDAQRLEGFVGWLALYVVFIVLLDWLWLRRWERRAVRWQPSTLTFADDDQFA